MVLIFFLSSQPHLPRYPRPLIDLLLKKVAHLFEYAVLAILLHRAMGNDYGWRALLIGGFTLSPTNSTRVSFRGGMRGY